MGVDGGEWGGECLCGNLAKRTKRERKKKEFGIGLVVSVLNHKGAKTQKGHKEKSVKICLIREHFFEPLRSKGAKETQRKIVQIFNT